MQEGTIRAHIPHGPLQALLYFAYLHSFPGSCWIICDCFINLKRYNMEKLILQQTFVDYLLGTNYLTINIKILKNWNIINIFMMKFETLLVCNRWHFHSKYSLCPWLWEDDISLLVAGMVVWLALIIGIWLELTASPLNREVLWSITTSSFSFWHETIIFR